MPLSSTGIATRLASSASEVEPGKPILSSRYNGDQNDLYDILSNATYRDGRAAFTDKVSGVDGTDPTHLVTKQQMDAADVATQALIDADLAAAQAAAAAAEVAALTAASGNALRFDTERLGTNVSDVSLVFYDAGGSISALASDNGSFETEHVQADTFSGRAAEWLRSSRLRSLYAVTISAAPFGLEIITGPNQPVARGMRMRWLSQSTGYWIEGRVLNHIGGCVVMWVDAASGSGSVSDLVGHVLPSNALSGAGVPSPALGGNGSSYLDTSTNQTWLRIANVWRAIDLTPKCVNADLYVNASSGFGLGTGNDANPGSKAAPFATLAAAIAAATDGQAIAINGTFTLASELSITKSLTFISAGPLSGKITRSANVRLFNLPAGASGKTLTLFDVDLDGAGYAEHLSNVADTAANCGITIVGGRARNWLGRVIASSGTATRLDLKLYNIDWSATGMAGGVNVDFWTAGSIEAIGCTVSLLSLSSGTEGFIHAKANATGVTALLVDNYASATVPVDAATTTGYLLRFRNIANGRMWGGVYSVTSGVGTLRNGAPISVTADSTTPLDSSGWLYTGVEFVSGVSKGGYIQKIGEEDVTGAATGYLNGHVSRWCYLRGSGTESAQTGGLHGVFAGSDSNAKWQFCWIEQAGYSVAFKDTAGALLEYCILVDGYNDAIRTKGPNTGGLFRCTLVQTANVTTNASILRCTGSDVVPGRNTTTFAINECIFVNYVAGGFGIYLGSLLNLTSSQDVVLTRNIYHGPNGWGSSRFTWGGGGSGSVNYNNADDYLTAKEATSFADDPRFANPTLKDYRLVGPSVADNLGVTSTALTYDFNGVPISNPAPAGAFERA